MAYNNTYGSKYEETKNLNRADLKVLMMADLKAAQKSGELPKCRITMRESRGVGTRGLTVTLAALPVKVLNPERVRLDNVDSKTFVEEYRCPRITAEATALRTAVEHIVEAYNYDRSDIQTDYFDVRFYLHVEFNAKEVEAEKRAIINAASPLRRELTEMVETAYSMLNDMLLEEGVKPWKYGPGEPEYFAGRFDQVFAKRGKATNLRARVCELKARIAATGDWNTAARAA